MSAFSYAANISQIPDDNNPFGLVYGTPQTVLGLLAAACWGTQLAILKGDFPPGNTSF